MIPTWPCQILQNWAEKSTFETVWVYYRARQRPAWGVHTFAWMHHSILFFYLF